LRNCKPLREVDHLKRRKRINTKKKKEIEREEKRREKGEKK
jgi:hypothetical protein